MTQSIFTPEFYKEVYNGLMTHVDDCCNLDKYEEAVQGNFIGMDYETEDGIYITCEVRFEHETNVIAGPYDHPYYETCDLVLCGIIDMVNVKVYESTNRDSKEIKGFDTEAFFKANN